MPSHERRELLINFWNVFRELQLRVIYREAMVVKLV